MIGGKERYLKNGEMRYLCHCIGRDQSRTAGILEVYPCCTMLEKYFRDLF